MACISNKFQVLGQTPPEAISSEVADNLQTVIEAAGHTIMLRSGADDKDSAGNIREFLVRMASLDRYHSHADYYIITNRSTAGAVGGTLRCLGVLDWSVGDSFPASFHNALQVSIGTFAVNTSYPTTSTPTVITGPTGTSSHQLWTYTFADGAEAPWTQRVIASEYGFAMHIQTTGTASKILAVLRPMDYERAGRDIHVDGVPNSSYGNLLSTALGGEPHLKFLREGRVISSTFELGTSPTIHDMERVITLQARNEIEAEAEDVAPAGSDDLLRVRIPFNSNPIGDLAVVEAGAPRRPSIQCFYQNPAWRADTDVRFDVWNSLDADGQVVVVTGASGTVTLSGRAGGNSWTRDVGARIGTVVYNHTTGDHFFITGFSTSVTPDDIAEGVVPGGWDATNPSGDDIEVLKGPADHADGCGGHGGVSQAVNDTPATNVTQGSTFTLRLSDVHGEAYEHFEPGMTTFLVANNGWQRLPMVSVAGYRRGEVVEQTTGLAAGTRGVVREIVTGFLYVDTIRGAANAATPYAVMPWGNGTGGGAAGTETILGLESGASSTITGVTLGNSTPANIGWMQRPPITAVRQYADSGGGDFRTEIDVNMSVSSVNLAAVFGPCLQIGVRAKNYTGVNVALPYSTTGFPTADGLRVIPAFLGDPFTTTDVQWRTQDLRSAERAIYATAEQTPHEPDSQTYQLEAAEALWRTFAETRQFADTISNLPHFLFVNARAQSYEPDVGDILFEDQVTVRQWVPVGTFDAVSTGANAFGATITGAKTQYLCLGPALNLD